jgi:hypothetical protein
VVGLAPGTVLASELADGTIGSTVNGVVANETIDTTEEST